MPFIHPIFVVPKHYGDTWQPKEAHEIHATPISTISKVFHILAASWRSACKNGLPGRRASDVLYPRRRRRTAVMALD